MSTFKRCCQTVVCLAGLSACPQPVPIIDINPSAELVTSEDGKSVKLTVSLLEPPPGTLIVSASSSDASEASVSAPLHFDDSNWQTSQDIVITGLDDAEMDGDRTYEVTVDAESSIFGVHQHVVVKVFSFLNTDNEVARFSGLGDLPGGAAASYATAVSAAGNVIVGWSLSEQGDEAFRWTRDSGISGLGGNQSRANDVSPNGHVIVGSVDEASYDSGRAAAIWREGSPIEVVAPYPPPGQPTLFYPVDATVALDSGLFVGACIQYGAYSERLICSADANGDFETDGGGDVFAGDAAGHFVGTIYPPRHGNGAGPIGYESGLLSFPLVYPSKSECVLPHECAAFGRAFSTDPVTIVGTALVPPVGHTTLDSTLLIPIGFVVTEGEGVMRLQDLADGDEDSGAYAIDASGRVIGGFGTDGSGRHAIVWVDRVARLLTDVITSMGGSVPNGWSLREVRAMSDDGLTFAGNGTNPAGEPEAFVAVLPSAL